MKTSKLFLIIIVFCLSSIILNAQEFTNIKGDYLDQKPPGIVPEIFAPGLITGFVHGSVAISPKGDEFFWIINPSTERIMFSKLENGTWTKPALADFVKNYLTSQNGGLAFSPMGDKLFFHSTRSGGFGGFDAWYVEKTDNGWSEPINAGNSYNSTYDESTPLITKKGYAYLLAGFHNSRDPLCYKYSNGKFSNHTPMDIIPEYGPWWTLFISSDEDYLIFAGNADDADLYIRFKNKQGQWGTPINMGNKINTTEWERFPVVSPDGKYLFFTRGNGQSANIFWVSAAIIDDLKKESIKKGE
ncbi:MAG: PD40 domain-containing protein [Calditrichaceae bacterium]|nr:PD40 domain-containing protein [Calditrichaceae bacterium]